MIGMPIGKKTPKSELHEFYQLHPGNPTFAIKSMSNPPAEPLFLCTLTCPGIGGPQGLPEQSFTGQGRNKKTAEQYAAEKALGFLRQRGLMAPVLVEMAAQQLPPDLQRQLAGTSTQPTTLQELQASALRKSIDKAPTFSQDPQALQLAPTTNGDGEPSGTTVAEDLESLDKDALILKLKQALKENQRLKEEVNEQHQRKQVAVDYLLGVTTH
ncbi:MAG: hypothetical protein FRX49_08463 [Trebouxia sp. A1-2]|nr:MAG: hypothetical protein FRX49_08463 [Trebouxia sp. A1-2]